MTPDSDERFRLSRDDVVRRASIEPDQLDRLIALGLIVPSPNGDLESGDVTRIRLLAALEASGIDLEEVAAATHEGRLSLGFAGQVMADPVGLADRTLPQAVTDLQLDADFVARLLLATGIPTPPSDHPIREDDLELLGIVARARTTGVGEESLLRLLRVFGMSVRSVVDVQRELFRESVEERLLESGMSGREMLEAGAEIRLQLQRLGFRTVFLLMRRFLEQAVFENLVDRVEETLAESDIIRSEQAPQRTIVFVDLSGYTRLTEESGDQRAAEHGTRLVDIAQDSAARSDGQIVKSLGDGAMLRFADPAAAVLAALDIVDGAREAGLPPARAGIATGAVVLRDGDCFGRTVNQAARLVDATGPGTVRTTEGVRKSAGSSSVVFREAGTIELKGFDEPVPTFLARRSDQRPR